MAFPDTPLGARIELGIGGVWTAVTPDSYLRDRVTITRGIPSNASTADPGRCSLTLKNTDGKYSPRNPRSPYYGKIGRNTPLRVSVPGAEPYLYVPEGVAGRATTPDTAVLDITGDIDVRVDLAPRQWAGAGIGYELIGKYGATSGNRSWRLMITGEGELLFTWSPDGTNTLEHRSPKLRARGPRMSVRATLDVNNGAGGYTLTYYTAASLAGPWTQIGQTVTTSGVTAIFASTAAVELGDIATMGYTNHERRIYGAEIRSGIGGTLVAAPSLSAQTAGATSFTDSTGKVWTVANGASISDRSYRFVGEVSAWPPKWTPSGRDGWTSVDAAGTLRRLSQGKKALDSTLRRRLPSRPSLLAYWPCEDSNGSTQAYSPLATNSPLRVTGWTFAQDDTLGGSAALPTVAPGGTMRGTVPAPVPASTTWAVCLLYRVDGAAPAAEQELLSWQTSGTVRRWRITQGATGSHVLGYDQTGALNVDVAIATNSSLFQGWWRLEFTVTQSGGTVAWTIGWTQVGGGHTQLSDSVAGTVGQVTQIDTVFGGGLPDIRAGHLTVWSADAISAAYASADKGFDGETAGARLTRLGAEEAQTLGIATYQDLALVSEAMGPQRPAALLDLLRDCADSDGGLLTEARESATLVYRERATLYNQPPKMVIPYGSIDPDLEPVEDDQSTRNDRTVNRIGGTSARAVREDGPLSIKAPPLGVGVYDDSIDLSLATDQQPRQIAGWLRHLGTWDEARYPTVKLKLHRRPELIPGFLGLELGDRIQITSLPDWLPPGPIDLLVLGITETPGVRTWDISLTCVPAGPWTVGVVGDPVQGRLATDGCTLGAGVSSTATTFTFVSSPGPRWIDSAAYSSRFPFDVLIGGELIRITAITGTTLTQTANGIRSVNGITKSHTAGAAVQVATPARLAL
ncbi:hypothetical protein [Streptomyces sp. NPDC048659]|uniref:hypothetical protein n=1 Tax=Streptomyces sp. NPDC048659 TaxID=3155489 RepID=UPI0034308526